MRVFIVEKDSTSRSIIEIYLLSILSNITIDNGDIDKFDESYDFLIINPRHCKSWEEVEKVLKKEVLILMIGIPEDLGCFHSNSLKFAKLEIPFLKSLFWETVNQLLMAR